MTSITKLLCESDTLADGLEQENLVIKDIFSSFEVLYPQIVQLRLSCQKSEKELLTVYQKYYTTLRGFFGGVYRSG